MLTGELPDPPRGLVEDIKRQSVIAIVGSGLSCAAGAPSWKQLLQGLAADAAATQPHERARIATALLGINQGRLIEAASLLKGVLGSELPRAVVYHLGHRRRLTFDVSVMERVAAGMANERFFVEEAPPEPVVLRPTVSHRILVQLGLRAIVTTNYDDLLERAWPGAPPATYSWSYEHLAERVQDGHPFILKIHGDLRHPNDLVLAREDYAAVQFGSRARRALKALFATYRPLWIGYGHNDPDLDLLLDECRAEIGSSGGYAVGMRSDGFLVGRLQNAGIVPSLLNTYADVPRYLQRLAELAERPLVFTVTIALPWPGETAGMALGHALAHALRPFGEVTVWGAEPGSLKLHLEAQVKVLHAFRALLEQRDPAFLGVLAQFGVTHIDGVPIADPGNASANVLATGHSGDRSHAAQESTQRGIKDKISLTYFVDFVLKAGTPKVTGVREFKERREDLVLDFYRQIREAIVDMHRNNKPDAVLDEFLAALRDERRRRVYPSIVAGYRKFLASGKITWFEPPVGTHRLGDLDININPDLGLVIDGKPHLIKIYFRGEPLSAKRIAVVLNLLAGGLEEANPGKVLALLDVRNAKLHKFKAARHTSNVPNSAINVLALRDLAASFAKMQRG